MSINSVHRLRLLRDTAREVRKKLGAHDQASTVGHMAALLDDMLVQENALKHQNALLEERMGALLRAAGRNKLASASDAAHAVQHELAATTALREPAAIDFFRSAIQADQDFWRGYDEAVKAEGVAASPAAETIKPPDDIDTKALQKYVTAALPGESAVKVLHARTVSRGFSKKTVLATLEGNRELPSEIALRIDQPFSYLGTTVVDEYPYLNQLWAHGARIPRPFSLEHTGRVLGQPFIIFSAVRGAAVGGNYASLPRNEALVADIAACLARIHSVPVGPLRSPSNEGTRAPHIDGEIDAYYKTWCDTRGTSATVEAGFVWIRENLENAYGPEAVVHNDYNFNNMLIDNSKVMAIVDWEFAHIGTPAADLGYFYYAAQDVASFDFFLDCYKRAGGIVPAQEQLDFYIFWGQLRLVVMGYQMLNGLNSGLFKDIRFGAAPAYLRCGLLRIGEKLQEMPPRIANRLRS